MPKSTSTAAGMRRGKQPAPRRPRKRAPAGMSDVALAAFAHEIRTPLTGILACAELLATAGLSARERAWAETIKSNAEHLATLTTLAVDAVRARETGLPLRREVFAPRSLAQAVADSMRARAEAKGLKARFATSGRLPAAVTGDSVRLRAALENLIDNAVKFTERGHVRLKLTAAPAARGRVRLSFTVSDTGVGLTPAEMKRLFRPFAQANPEIAHRFGGSGLGLASVKTVAKAMGGDLRVSCAPSRGSSFHLDVVVEPAEPAAARAAGAGAGFARAAPARRLRILCAEDNPFGRVVLNTILTEFGHAIDFVGSGEAVLQALARGGYDLVLLDIVLAGMDGLETARRIRALPGAAARTPIVGLSGRAELAGAEAAREAGIDAFLVKPVSPAALAGVLRELSVSRAG